MALALLATPPARTAPSGTEEFWQVGHITFEGNETFSKGELRRWIRTRTRSFPFHMFRKTLYRRDFIRGDKELLQAFYRRQGFLAAAVDDRSTFDPDRHEVDVAFIVAEGPRTTLGSVAYLGITQVPMRDVLKGTVLKAGEPYNPFAIALELARVERVYGDEGLYPSDTAWVDTAGYSARVTLRFTEGRPVTVREVHLPSGLSNRPFVIRREMDTRPGARLSQKKVEEDKARLYASDLFQAVQIHATRLPAPGDTLADVSLDLIERKPRWVEGGIGYGTHDFFRLSTGLGLRSLAWTGRRLSTQTTFAFSQPDSTHGFRLQEGRTEVAFLEPWFLGTRTKAELRLYANLQRSDSLLPEYRRGVALTFTRKLSRFTKTRLGLLHEGLNPFDGPGLTSNQAQAGLDRDRRDNAFDPVYGSYQQLNLLVAGGFLGGNTTFHKEVSSVSLYRPVPIGRSVLAVRISGGYVAPFHAGTDTIQSVYRFTTGGATTVRGYKENEIGGQEEEAERHSFGGRVQLLTNAELRFPIRGIFSGAIFLDGGGVWSDPADISLKAFSPYALRGSASFNRYRYTAGGGVRVSTPVGPFRLDYGRKLNPPEVQDAENNARPHDSWHISLGQAY